MKEDVCRGCGAQIAWIRSARGRMIPCDARPVRYREDPGGSGVVVTEDGRVVRCALEFEGLPTGMARTPHLATCKGPAGRTGP